MAMIHMEPTGTTYAMVRVSLLSQNADPKKVIVLRTVHNVAIQTTRNTWRKDDQKAHTLTGIIYSPANAQPNGIANCATTMPPMSSSVTGMRRRLVRTAFGSVSIGLI